MSFVIGPTTVYDFATVVLGAVSVAISGSSGGPITRVLFNPGAEVAWDNCECGQIALFVPNRFASRIQGQPNTEYQNCTPPLRTIQFSLQIVRCVPGMSDVGTPPKPGSLTNAARILEEDAYLVWHSVQHVIKTAMDYTQLGGPTLADGLITDQSSLGPQGQCAGSELHFQAAWTRDDC